MGHKNWQAGHIWVLGCNLLSNFTWLSVEGAKEKRRLYCPKHEMEEFILQIFKQGFKKKKWKELDERIQCVGGERPVLFDIV